MWGCSYMGYQSSLSGKLKFRKEFSELEIKGIVASIESFGSIEVQVIENGIEFFLYEWKFYPSYEDVQKLLGIILTYFNGELFRAGEDNKDIETIHFKDGNLGTQKVKIEWEEIDWNQKKYKTR